MKRVKTFKEILSQGFSTVDADMITGEKQDTKYVSRISYLADFEIDKLVEALRKTVSNIPQE